MNNFRLYNRSQSRNQRFAFNRLHLEGEREHWVSHKRRWRVSNLLQGKWKSVPECWNFSKKRTQWSVLFYNFTMITFFAVQFSRHYPPVDSLHWLYCPILPVWLHYPRTSRHPCWFWPTYCLYSTQLSIIHGLFWWW